jgi:hypothetical protein
VSDFTAVAAVTATLRRTLLAAVQADVPAADVTTVRPATGDNTHLPTTGVNVFLYRVAPNPHWRNGDLPSRRGDGELAQRPQAALDLQYLFSFYGSDTALEPQRLLGSTAAFLHSQPLLTRSAIRTAVSDPTRPFLANSDLADQVDLVRFAPLSLTLDELSRLWSVFFQVPYVLSMAFQASIVLVERQETPRPALPTRTFGLATVTVRKPRIASVTAAADGDPIVSGSAVVIHGEALQADVTRVEIDGADVTVGTVSGERIALTLPAGLSAGAHGVQIRQGVEVGGAGRLVFASDLATFALQPRITQTGGDFDIDVAGDVMTVGVDPGVEPRQTVTAELLTAEDVVAHTRMAAPRPSASATAVFDVADVPAGTYRVRVRVDGAESPLEPGPPEVTL